MKTFEDLMLLIANEYKLNEGKAMQVNIEVSMQFKWISMYKDYSNVSNAMEKDVIFTSKSFEHPSQLQEVYWTIYNNGRSFDINEVHE